MKESKGSYILLGIFIGGIIAIFIILILSMHIVFPKYILIPDFIYSPCVGSKSNLFSVLFSGLIGSVLTLLGAVITLIVTSSSNKKTIRSNTEAQQAQNQLKLREMFDTNERKYIHLLIKSLSKAGKEFPFAGKTLYACKNR